MVDKKEVEEDIRDLINDVKVFQDREVEVSGGSQKISDEAAKKIISKLEQIAQDVGDI